MASSGSNALQKGLYDVLTGGGGVGAPVYDHVPQNSAFPYIKIGQENLVEFDTKSTFGRQGNFTIHVFDTAAGNKTVKTIMDAIYQRLHRKEAGLSVVGFEVVNCYCTFTKVMLQSDQYGGSDKYMHGVMDFEIQIGEV